MATNPWVRRGAVVVAAATVALIFAGSLVTSTGSGLAVPDWPLSYGQLFLPMVDGILYEHGHRLVAGTVALLVLGFNGVVLRVERRRGLAEVPRFIRGFGRFQGLCAGSAAERFG